MTNPDPGARFDPTATAVVIRDLVISHPDVAREAQRWTTGQRGAVVDDIDELARADLAPFVTQAVLIGSQALAATAQTSDVKALEVMLKDVGDRTADATTRAAELTERASRAAAETVGKVAADARKAITDADRQSRAEFVAAVDGAKTALAGEVRRLLGGERPELLDRLQPLLDRFGSELDAKARAATVEMLERAAKQFDPTDPASPMAKHTAALTAQYERVVQQVQENHQELAARFESLTAVLKINDERTQIARVTPIKGGSFEGQIHAMMRGIAIGLGDEYEDATATVGRLPRCKKGDGVLHVGTGAARVVLEMTDSAARSTWSDYLDEAERNRGAAAAVGIVRSPEQNAGQVIRVVGARRLILAYDPDHDDPEFLRTVVLLARTMAMVTTSRTGEAEIATAEEKVVAALEQLNKIDSVKRLADGIQKSALKIDGECTSINASIKRLLGEALLALTAAPSDGHVGEPAVGAA